MFSCEPPRIRWKAPVYADSVIVPCARVTDVEPDRVVFAVDVTLVDNITAMEFKRYDNRNYREARAQSPFGREDPPLEDVVRGIVRFMRRHRILESGRRPRVLENA